MALKSPLKLETTPQVSRRMKRTLQRDTPAELAIRKGLFHRGYRYRINAKIPGATARPDILFVYARLAVFVDGCFWHGCPLHATWPKRNAEWWAQKLTANWERDRRHDANLHRLGWTVFRAWEHENASSVVERIASLLQGESRD